MRAAWCRVLATAVCVATVAAPARGQAQSSQDPSVRAVVPNDNRLPGGRIIDGRVELHLVARLAAWRPDLEVDSAVTVQAFAEADGVPRIPGPLLRAKQGTEIRITVANHLPDSTLVVSGLRAGTVPDDTLHVRPGERRELRYLAGAPGTYLYWGTTSGSAAVSDRRGRDGQLTGAIVIDPEGVAPEAAERIFVMTVVDVFSDTTMPPPHEDIWELAINGLSWPHTERLEYDVGRPVRWRWLNGTYLPHPMHLHGFHFRVLAKGDGMRDVPVAAHDVRDVVTEFMRSGSTFAMEWTPTRAGNWLFHCHMAPHITPFPPRPDSIRGHDEHDVVQHALYGMAGLVLGIHTVEPARSSAASPPPPTRHLRLFVQQAAPASAPELRAAGFVVQEGEEPRSDSVSVPGTPIVLTRGETVAITVVNRIDDLTTVHWHGMELESLYDGVAGWSGAGSNLAPLIAPGDSFAVAFTPPRAGTYIYHTHMDEGTQLGNGLYGALLVLEPGERHDPETDLVFIAGRAIENGVNQPAINGRHDPPPLALRAGRTYRLRIINILPAAPIEVELVMGEGTAEGAAVGAAVGAAEWLAVSKDGADLPPSSRVRGPALLRPVGVGETYDFEWTPAELVDAALEMRLRPPGGNLVILRQPLLVR